MECGFMDGVIYGVWVHGWSDIWSVGSWMECGFIDHLMA